mgnify:FL=1
MRLLLDTHLVLWWMGDMRELGKEARRLIADPGNSVFVSTVTLWEIWLKCSLGKLRVDSDLEERLREESFEILPLAASHARRVGALAWHHRDPFDRMLVAQADEERMTLLTVDTRMGAYGEMVRVLR